MPLEGKTVLVTGVGAGLGRRVALGAARDGARVVLAARSAEALAEIAEEAAQEAEKAAPGGRQRVAHRAADITDGEDCARLAALCEERFGGVDALVQVAAQDRVFGGLDEADPEFADWRGVLEVNLYGTLRVTRACLPSMRRRGGGSVVWIGTQSSVAAPNEVRQAAYAASKGALTSAMYSLAREVGPDRIRVNSVQPGWMWGPAVAGFVRGSAAREGVPEETVKARLAKRMALPEPAGDDDVAEAALFFASDRARAITGQQLLVNAGEFMR
ncbi:SDR family oxidoreductase [Phaeacidiphilus oryzae]|uniref:SDR family oxidoreductase n=1 Tax=Phaeacidiphilus oryzae TaxID=348818 RepID=UPI003899EE02